MMRPETRVRVISFTLIAAAVLATSGCDLLPFGRPGTKMREADQAVSRGDYKRAIELYESALDGTLLSAEAHYRLGLIYEDQLKNSVGALHHFQRYLELAPEGQFANDVKNYTKRIELVMTSRLSEGAVLPVTEATRLKNENQALRQELTELKKRGPATQRTAGTPSAAMAVTPLATPAPVFPPPLPVAPAAAANAQPEVRRAVPVSGAAAATPAPTPAGPRTYVVQKGDTLAGISRKFYKSANQWQKIAEANKDILPDPTKLKIGTELKIPE